MSLLQLHNLLAEPPDTVPAAVGRARSLLGPPRSGQAASHLYQKHLLFWTCIHKCQVLLKFLKQEGSWSFLSGAFPFNSSPLYFLADSWQVFWSLLYILLVPEHYISHILVNCVKEHVINFWHYKGNFQVCVQKCCGWVTSMSFVCASLCQCSV